MPLPQYLSQYPTDTKSDVNSRESTSTTVYKIWGCRGQRGENPRKPAAREVCAEPKAGKVEEEIDDPGADETDETNKHSDRGDSN